MSSAVDPSLHAAASNLAVQTSAKPIAGAVELEPGVPSDVDLMLGIQSGDAEALSKLYDRYNGVVKALILRIIHDETGADDLLQEVCMEIWDQAMNFSAPKQYGPGAKDFINESHSLHEAFALSPKPAKATAAIKDRLMSMVGESTKNQ